MIGKGKGGKREREKEKKDGKEIRNHVRGEGGRVHGINERQGKEGKICYEEWRVEREEGEKG